MRSVPRLELDESGGMDNRGVHRFETAFTLGAAHPEAGMFEPDGLIWLALLGGAVALWMHSSAMRERARGQAVQICRDTGYQCLDDTVVLASVYPSRSRGRGARLEWRYAFEFSSNGADRRPGRLALVATGLAWAQLETPEGTLILDDGGRPRHRH